MEANRKALDIIKKYEGCRLTAYKSPSGVWTIGYGHTAGVKPGQMITKEEAEKYLEEDIEWAVKEVRALRRTLNQNQFDALVSFTCDCGPMCLKQLCQGRDEKVIGEKMVLYNKAGGKVLGGLTKRRMEEQKLYQSHVEERSVAELVKELPILQRGDTGPYVKMLQNALLENDFKYYIHHGVKRHLHADGVWGEATEGVFCRWQNYKGLKVDGICGEKSWSTLQIYN